MHLLERTFSGSFVPPSGPFPPSFSRAGILSPRFLAAFGLPAPRDFRNPHVARFPGPVPPSRFFDFLCLFRVQFLYLVPLLPSAALAIPHPLQPPPVDLSFLPALLFFFQPLLIFFPLSREDARLNHKPTPLPMADCRF